MNDCEHELNKQIRGIQARLTQAENNITNHFTGISMLVKGMLANPFTASPAAIVQNIYNLMPSGMDVLQKLLDQVPVLDMKTLMMNAAAALEDMMEAELNALISMAEEAIDGAIAAAGDMVNSAIATAEAAAIALEDAIAAGIQGPIDAANAALEAANDAVLSAQKTLDDLMANAPDLKMKSKSMIQAQADAAKCKSVGVVISS